MPSSPAVIAEFTARKDGEKDKALKKYGPTALLPAGRPEFDVLDYAINELVGLIRYAQMIHSRHELMLDTMEPMPKRTRELLKDGKDFARELEAFDARYSFNTIDLRQKLKKQGLHLGLTEASR